jgi:hypothetical protein
MPRIPGEFWAIPKDIMAMKSLSLEARMVYAVLFTRRNGENKAWPSQKYIADILGVGIRSIRRYIDELVIAGLVIIHRRGLRKSNAYSLIGQVGRSREDTVGRSGWAKLAAPKVRELSVREHSKSQELNLFTGVEKIGDIINRTYK